MADDNAWTIVQDLVESKRCTPMCLFGMRSEEDCGCRCRGEFHGLALRVAQATPETDLLAGRFFHSFKEEPDGCRIVEWQGVIIGRVAEGMYLVQLFEWIMGGPSNQHLVPLASMVGWNFYSTSEDMSFEYNESLTHRYDRHREHERTSS